MLQPALPRTIAFFPASAWAFALRNWVAMALALLIAFWLQLEGASSAATCVGILSLQTRGQVLQKAIYRLLGTVVGVGASLAIAGAFSQTRDLFFLACCVWLGLCTMLASLLSGTEAYSAVLSGYTVAIVAIPNVDTPLNTFSAGMNRGAAIVIGILAMAVVGDVLRAPNLFDVVAGKLEGLRVRTRAFVASMLNPPGAKLKDVAALFRQLTALEPDISALPSESVSGHARAQAARTALVGMLREIAVARTIARMLRSSEPSEDASIHAAEERLFDDRLLAEARLVLDQRSRDVDDAIAAMWSGGPPPFTARLIPYKSRPAAMWNAVRAAVSLAASTYALSLLGWPASTAALVQVGAMIGLSATSPDPRAFALGAVIAMPLAAVAAGVTEFLVLDGASQFELLFIAMGPPVIAASLLLASGKPLLYGIGFLIMVYFPIILSPTNPQSYNPETFLFGSYLSILGAILLFICLATLFPIGDAQKGIWIERSSRRDLRAAFEGNGHRNVSACVFRDCDRIGQRSGLVAASDPEAELDYLMQVSDFASCIRTLKTTLDADLALRSIRPTALAALRNLDPAGLRDAAGNLLVRAERAAGGDRSVEHRAAMQLLLAAMMIDWSPKVVSELRSGTAS